MEKNWFPQVLSYLRVRVPALEDRFIESFRYVDVDPDNGNTFSHEYSSILTDACRAFGSAMDMIVKNEVEPGHEGEFDIWDYCSLLNRKFVEPFDTGVERGLFLEAGRMNLTWVSLSIDHQRARGKMLMPFDSVVENTTPMRRWTAHNKLKHEDVENAKEGSFKNAFNAVASVAFLYSQMSGGHDNDQVVGPLSEAGRRTRLFKDIGYLLSSPSEETRQFLFFS